MYYVTCVRSTLSLSFICLSISLHLSRSLSLLVPRPPPTPLSRPPPPNYSVNSLLSCYWHVIQQLRPAVVPRKDMVYNTTYNSMNPFHSFINALHARENGYSLSRERRMPPPPNPASPPKKKKEERKRNLKKGRGLWWW